MFKSTSYTRHFTSETLASPKPAYVDDKAYTHIPTRHSVSLTIPKLSEGLPLPASAPAVEPRTHLQKLVAVGHALVAKPEGDEHGITDEEWRDLVICYAKLKTLSYEDRERETRKLRIVYSEHPFYSRSFVRLTDVLRTDVSPWADRCTFIKRAAEAFITFGIPTHSMGSHIEALARVLDVDARFFVLPHYTSMTFRDPVTSLESTTTLALRGGMALGKLTDVHVVFKGVLHDQISAADGTVALRALLKTPPEYGLAIQVLLAFLAAALVCPLGFGGSLVDAVLAGAAGVAVASVKAALGTSAKDPMVFESVLQLLRSRRYS
jgi:uncharacterized membrane protein YjjP (DUF1212 family)